MRASNVGLDAVEFYLPQFLHCLIHVQHEIENAAALERFVLAACRVSSHMARSEATLLLTGPPNDPANLLPANRRCWNLPLSAHAVAYLCGN